MTLQHLAEQREELREARRRLAEEDKQLAHELAELDQQIMEHMDQEGLDALRVDGLSISISSTVVPSVKDWAQVYEFVQETGNFQLFERRMASAAFRELREQLGDIPGTEPFTRRTINMRRVAG